MPLSIWLAAAAIASSLPIAWWALGSARNSAAAHVRTNLATGARRVGDLRDIVLEQSARDRVVNPVVSGLARQARRLTPVGVVDKLDGRLKQAGLAARITVEQVLAWKLVLGVVATLLGLVTLAGSFSLGRLALVAILVAGAAYVPDLWLSSRADARQAEIERALADALDQITVCVEAGLSFEAAMARIAGGPGPLANEFGRTLQDIQIGIPRARALENLLERTAVADLRAFVHAFGHAERFGIPIAQVLRAQSSELRDKRRARAEERAQKIPVKIVFPVVVCILPALLLVVAGPGVVRIAEAFS
jgi:tight adherence protein C